MNLTKGEKIGLVGSVLTIIGAFLPWATWGAFSVSGTDGDGVLTLIFGIIVGALIYFRPWDNKNKAISLILGLLILAVGIYDAYNIANVAEAPLNVGVEVGTGLYVTILGGLIVLFCSIIGFLSKETPSRKIRSGESEGRVL